MQEEPALVELFKRFYGIVSSGDASAVDELISGEEGALGIGTDPREWWAGPGLIDALRAQAPEMHDAGLRFEFGDPQAYSEGSVGWIADQPKLKMPDGSEVPMRLTAVCHKEQGTWKMVQFHLSIGVANEEALGEELTVP